MAQWTRAYGLSGTQVNDLVTLGPHVFAGIPYEGIYLSSDDGKAWSPAPGLPSETVITRFATLGDDLFLGTTGGRVFRSSDRGATWEAADSTLPGSFLQASIDAMVAQGASLFVSTNGRIYRTGDRGRSWSEATPTTPADVRVNLLLVQGPVLFAGTERHWLHATTDQGTQWTRLAAPPEVEDFGAYPVAAAGGWMYATCGGLLLRTSDQGKAWSRVDGLPTSATSTSGILQVGAFLLASLSSGGVFRSEDGGVTWIPSERGLPKNVFFGGMVATGSRILLPTGTAGIFASSDGGLSWTSSSLGLPTKNMIRTLGASGTEAFATTYGDVFRSRDGGSVWTGMDFPSLGPGGHSAKITCLTHWGGDLVLSGGKGVWRHRDGAFSPWSQVGVGLPSTEIKSVAAAGPTLLAESQDTLYVLDLADSTWKGIPWSPGPHFLHDGGMVSLEGVHLIRGTNDYGIFRSVEGRAWSLVKEGLPVTRVEALAVHGKRVFAGSWGISRSEDKGLTWIPSDSGMPKTAIRALASKGRYLFAGTADLGIFMSSDSGSSWAGLESGFPAGETVLALAANDQHLYASLANGLWRHPLPGPGTRLKARRAIRPVHPKTLHADAAGRRLRPGRTRPGPAYLRN